MSEPTYPQYRITVRWEEDDDEGGRRDNSTLLDRMYREDPGTEEIERWTREEWWPGYVANKAYGGRTMRSRNPSDPTVEVESQGEESWCLSWFEHWTFDVGQTDAEALASFERYVRRYEHMQDVRPGEYPDGYRCLMGAEDRWRWCGGPSPDDRTPPPCRCEHCRGQGVIRIGH